MKDIAKSFVTKTQFNTEKVDLTAKADFDVLTKKVKEIDASNIRSSIFMLEKTVK